MHQHLKRQQKSEDLVIVHGEFVFFPCILNHLAISGSKICATWSNLFTGEV